MPLKRGRCGTFTHDYVRHGTTTLFAALEVLEGKVIGQCFPRHRHQEFLKFLRRLDEEFPETLELHLVLDNYGTHKHPKVGAWLKRDPRFVLHFIPTSSSWLNQVERWFGELTQKAVRRGAFASVTERRRRSINFAGVERGAQAICVDRDGGEDHGESSAGAPEDGRDKARVVAKEKAKKAEVICLAIYATLH